MKHLGILLLIVAFLSGCSPEHKQQDKMTKLYRHRDDAIQYWETWDNEGVHTVHWGALGEKGQSKELRDSFLLSAAKTVNAEIQKKRDEGYQEISPDKHHVLLIEYPIQGMGNTTDLDKRHDLESRMDETLGWTGLGHCDGGSIGSGTMEVCCLVVDFGIAKKVIQKDLAKTKFSDYSRIFEQESEGQQPAPAKPPEAVR
jgi:predicted DNA-binding WGR domain protein